MVLPALIDTPRTEAGNATFTSNSGLDFSIEQSFVSTSKENQDVLQRLQSKHKDTQLKTPSVRYPLLDRRNAPTGTSNGEFTPLLKSVAKSNLLRRHSKENGVPRTPAVLKSGYRSVDPSPALPAESSALWAGDTGSSFALGNSDETPMPNIASNSTTSTPLAKLPKSDDAAIVDDGKNVMTLREQENVINKVEKENFGLKLKVHFLEEALRKAGPGVSEAALKENTDLKVDRITLQKELHRCRKALGSAEHDLERYRRQPAELGALQEEVRVRKLEVEMREEKVRSLEDEIAALQDGVQGKLKAKERDAERWEEKARGLEDEIFTLRSDFQEELSAKEQEVHNWEGKLETLEDEIATLQRSSREELRAKTQDDKNWEEKARNLEDEMIALRRNFEEEVRECKREAETWEEKVEALEEEVVSLQDKFQEELRAKKREVETWEEKAQSLEDEITSLRSSIQAELRAKKQEVEGWEKKAQGLQDEILVSHNDLLEDLIAKKLEVERWEKKAQGLSGQLASLQSSHQEEVQAMKREVESWEKKAQGLEDEIIILQSSIDEESEQAKEDLSAARQEISHLRKEAKYITEKAELQSKQLEAYQDVFAQGDMHKAERDMLKQQIADCRRQQDLKLKDGETAEKTAAELHAKITELENELRDIHIENEKGRKNLREVLKDTKAEVEELNAELSQRNLRIESLTLREKDLRSQLQESREERSSQAQKASNATSELDILRRRYDVALEKVSRFEKGWEDDCRTMQQTEQGIHKQHHGELKGLAKQIMYLRKKCEREGRFRADLAFVKKFFIMQVEMYNACNHVDLQMLEEMGIKANPSVRQRRLSLKCVGLIIIASIRMRRLKEEWGKTVRVKERLMAALEQKRKKEYRSVG